MLGNPKKKMIRAKYLDLSHHFLNLCSLSTIYLQSFSCSQVGQRILMEKWFQKTSYPVKPILVFKVHSKQTLKKLGCPGTKAVWPIVTETGRIVPWFSHTNQPFMDRKLYSPSFMDPMRRFPTKSKSKFSISYCWWVQKSQGQPPVIYERTIYTKKNGDNSPGLNWALTGFLYLPSNSMSSVSRQQWLQEIAHVVSGPSVLETARSRPWKESTSPRVRDGHQPNSRGFYSTRFFRSWPFQWF